MSEQPPLPKWFTTNNNGTPTRRFSNGITHLNHRMERVIDLLINGAPDDPNHEPLGLYQAAKAVGYQRKAARELAISPVFTEACYAKKKAFDNNQPEPILCPSLEVVRLQMEHHRQMNKLLQELRDTQQKLDDKRREMVESWPPRTIFWQST